MEALKAKLKNYKKALKSFEDLLQTNLVKLKLEEKLIDGIKNGQVQKFEYCSELTWKLIRQFLLVIDGVETASPKGSIKEFFAKGYGNEPSYKKLLQMIDDRNELSHVYSEEDFEKIYKKLPTYLKAMKKVLSIIETKFQK